MCLYLFWNVIYSLIVCHKQISCVYLVLALECYLYCLPSIDRFCLYWYVVYIVFHKQFRCVQFDLNQAKKGFTFINQRLYLAPPYFSIITSKHIFTFRINGEFVQEFPVPLMCYFSLRDVIFLSNKKMKMNLYNYLLDQLLFYSTNHPLLLCKNYNILEHIHQSLQFKLNVTDSVLNH